MVVLNYTLVEFKEHTQSKTCFVQRGVHTATQAQSCETHRPGYRYAVRSSTPGVVGNELICDVHYTQCLIRCHGYLEKLSSCPHLASMVCSVAWMIPKLLGTVLRQEHVTNTVLTV